jgi:S-adenosylmethionine-diacylglycerol 3-amino-3-carboxypropyl transferase
MSDDLAFSQVREDWWIEWQVLDRLAIAQPSRPLRVLLVASGGCTALSLLGHPAIGQIDAIDANPAAIHLVELRKQALLLLSSEEINCLVGSGDRSRQDQRLGLYDRVRSYLPTDSQVFWDQRRDQISAGVNQAGRFEQLFRKLATRFAEAGLSPLEDPDAAIASPQWQPIFDAVFERQKLVDMFGAAAVNYSMDRSFGEHFGAVFAQAMQRFEPMENYFLTQIWADRYIAHFDGGPLYLEASAQAIMRPRLSQLQLHTGEFMQELAKLTQLTQTYDLIQFSNLSDWMPIPALNAMLQNIQARLAPGGATIGRRLNGDHNLADVMAAHFKVDRPFSQQLQTDDRSFFYSEVVVGWR